MNDELNDWANELDKIGNKITEVADDLREDKYATNRSGIIKTLEKCKADLAYAIEQLKKYHTKLSKRTIREAAWTINILIL